MRHEEGQVIIGSGNGLVPDRPKPLPEPVLINRQYDFNENILMIFGGNI